MYMFAVVSRHKITSGNFTQDNLNNSYHCGHESQTNWQTEEMYTSHHVQIGEEQWPVGNSKSRFCSLDSTTLLLRKALSSPYHSKHVKQPLQSSLSDRPQQILDSFDPTQQKVVKHDKWFSPVHASRILHGLLDIQWQKWLIGQATSKSKKLGSFAGQRILLQCFLGNKQTCHFSREYNDCDPKPEGRT